MALHETQLAGNRAAERLFNAVGVNILGVADADILSLTTPDSTNTTTGMYGMVGAKTCHETYLRDQRVLQQAILWAKAATIYTNTNIAAADTKAGIRTIHTTLDSSLSSSDDRSFGLPY